MPEDFEANVLLADGGSAHIRPLRVEDEPAVRALYERVSDHSRYLRFFSPLTAATAAYIENVHGDADHRFALVAEIGNIIVAIAEFDVGPEGDIAEVAFTVQDDQQGRGFGTILLEMLARAAAARGIRRFTAEFLVENDRMRDVLAHAGFTVNWLRADGGVGDATLELIPNGAWVDAHEQREHTAAAHSIARVLTPASIAVVGAGRDDNSIGHAIVHNLLEGAFAGAIHPVNPHASVIAGLPASPSVRDIPGAVDLAIVAVPAAAVLDVVRECADKGARGVVVISGGFAELEGGESIQDELVALCRGSGMRLVGPNCVGVVNTDPAVRMNATFSPVAPERGRVGFASQSGGVGIELLARAHALGLGVSSFISLGNKADVSGNDLLQYWADDDSTDVVLLYLESFGNPRKFARLAREISRHKPIITMKSGRTAAGARGARSHTAALADVDTAVDELLRQTGVLRVDTLEELLDTASLLVHQPVPAGRRVAVMSNGGGPGILAADAAAGAGLVVPELSPALQGRLRGLAPPGAGVQNPVDLIASAGPDVFRNAARALLASDEIDALLVIYVSPHVTRPEQVRAAVADAAGDAHGKPIAACFLGLDHADARIVVESHDGIPNFPFPESAARALAHAARLGEWRRRPVGVVPGVDGISREHARGRLLDALAAHPQGGWVDAEVVRDVLRDYGIPVVTTRRADTADVAARIAGELGFPVALKAASPDLVHKTDVGGVHLDLASAREVRDAFAHMQARLGDTMGGAMVQPMVPNGVELIAGITRDAHFGPLVVFGMGGFAAELERDTVIRIPPITDVDIDETLHALRGSPLLFGYRNSPPVDTGALADLLARVGRLAEDIAEIGDLDCNPIIASPAGVVVVDAKLRIAPDPRPHTAFDID
jgi:acetyl coenzyme A synthetase (ADP forming)-like protein